MLSRSNSLFFKPKPMKPPTQEELDAERKAMIRETLEAATPQNDVLSLSYSARMAEMIRQVVTRPFFVVRIFVTSRRSNLSTDIIDMECVSRSRPSS
jgi:hypothetical protein